MIEQTLFALPFAWIGLLFAGGGSLAQWLWVTVALVAARTAGMSFNRVIDADIDARNPRTSARHVPSGALPRSAVWALAAGSSVLLVAASYMLNALCFSLSFAAVVLLFSYSYFKRFTASSHFYLGFVEAAAPIGGYVAVTGRFDTVSFLLGGAIMMWIAGLDMVYALQDRGFDRREGLHSIPARFGARTALALSALSYCGAFACLFAAGLLTGRDAPYWGALACVGMVFARQQVIARGADPAPAILRFFSLNRWVSPILLAGVVCDSLIAHLAGRRLLDMVVL